MSSPQETRKELLTANYVGETRRHKKTPNRRGVGEQVLPERKKKSRDKERNREKERERTASVKLASSTKQILKNFTFRASGTFDFSDWKEPVGVFFRLFSLEGSTDW